LDRQPAATVVSVTKYHPHDYLPAAGHDAFLPGYDLLTRLFGFQRVHQRLID